MQENVLLEDGSVEIAHEVVALEYECVCCERRFTVAAATVALIVIDGSQSLTGICQQCLSVIAGARTGA